MYYSLGDLFWIFLLGLAAWYFWAGMAAKERVRRIVKRHCADTGVQLLDDTVMLVRTRVRRDRSGQVRLQRKYEFEFTSTGERRYSGIAVLHGQRVSQIQLSPFHMS
ncbi:DUF3301 domain-containing protein [Microbulbifer hydrolyticus]|uniref:DUF3301 domain-containing protein n=1 Tax=Microbulbifer hydrolyticus TaxID=48074 RepID=A0A6P1TD48_9GAMM|nr:DUF3301 domain-containing protein [Microbulbifer hydrolyticus]MBB5209877.1 hypothetical protein [Microbulbifer hydrolyticus]QHQ39583.1 DUF3301 domain-containing protein [Microbulbifer hydrolyticus]